jgi:hypothetical protein
MTEENQLQDKTLIAAIRRDCLQQAKTAKARLNEVVECLSDENHLGALGAFASLDEDIVCLKVFLTRIARLTAGRTTRVDQSHAEPKTDAE